MKKKQYMMMAAFLCTTTMAMAAPVNINTNQPLIMPRMYKWKAMPHWKLVHP